MHYLGVPNTTTMLQRVCPITNQYPKEITHCNQVGLQISFVARGRTRTLIEKF